MLNPIGIAQTVATFALASFIGIFIAQLLMAHRSVNRALFFVKPLINGSNLPDNLSLPAVIGIIDARAEHSIVSSMLRRRIIDEDEVLVYNLVTSPIGFLYTLRFIIPITIASLGLVAGGICIALHFLRSIIAFLMGFLWGRLFLRPRSIKVEIGVQGIDKSSISRSNVIRAARESLSMTIYFLKRYAIVLAILFLLNYLNVFSYITITVKWIASPIPLTPQALSILVTHTISPTSGYIVAGEMIRQGAVTMRNALTALVLGSFLFLLFFDITRHSFPFYATLYPVRTALKLSILLIITSAISLPVQLAIVSLIP